MRVLFALLLVPFACLAAAEPMDLRDARPRPVEIWFESSPDDRPGQLDTVYAWPVTGWLAPGAQPGQTQVRIPADEMTRYLAAYEPIEGSVSDFVWVFDAATGAVVSADFAATFREPVDLPFFTTHVATKTRTHLTTEREAGYLPVVERFGHPIYEFCVEAADDDCVPVKPRAYDPYTGYVNAVGFVDAVAVAGIEAQSFSPMGEAVFRELSPAGETAHLQVSAEAVLDAPDARVHHGDGRDAPAGVGLGPPPQ